MVRNKTVEFWKLPFGFVVNPLSHLTARVVRNFSAYVLVTVLCGIFASAAVAGPPSKATVCHFPPDNPWNSNTIQIDAADLQDHLAHGDLQGDCPPTAAELDPPVVQFDDALAPPEPTIAGVDGGPSRRLVRMNSDVGAGYQFDFVENEVYLITDDPADLESFQSRWPSEVLFSVEFPDTGAGANTVVLYLLQVDPVTANTRNLNKDLAGLDPRLHGQHQVSSAAGLQLLALVAYEVRKQGLRVGINVLIQTQDFFERISEEAMVGDDRTTGPLSFIYRPNAFEWPYMSRDPDTPGDSHWPLDTGVAEAMRVVEAEGRLGNRVRAMIADGGFYPNQDFPPYTMVGPLRTTNPDPGGCGAGAPPAPDSTCGTHGTHVLMSGFALPDNGFGTSGPGGAVTDLTLVQSPSLDFQSLVRFVVNAIPDALALRPQIINVSASVAIPGGWCFIACEPIDLLSDWLNSAGMLFVAAAGNQAMDVDELDEFCTIGCVEFEAAAVVPCETDHVICVGSHTFFESRRTGYSNYGSIDDNNSVDIYAPGNLYSVDAIQADNTTALRDDLNVITGTSYATPFTAGVIALTWAANPSLSNTQVRNCVMDNAHTESYTGERRRINALGAVSCAMGGSHPWVEVLSPSDGTEFVWGTDAVTLLAESDDYEDGPLEIQWVSSLDGDLPSTLTGDTRRLAPTALSVGSHVICATVVDSSTRTWGDCVDIEVTSSPPVVEILLPFEGVFRLSETIQFSALAYDPDDPILTSLEWRIGGTYDEWDDMAPLISGTLDFSMPATTFGRGFFRVGFRATNSSGVSATVTEPFSIWEDGDNLRPTVTIVEPEPGQVFESADGGPVTIALVAFAEDPEDGHIPFSEIEWLVSNAGGGYDDLPVTTDTRCVLYNPILDRCERYEVTHSIELAPAGSNTNTRFDIKARVFDSEGISNGSGDGRVTIYVTQVII